jgi:hypothetical protein
LAQNDVVWWKLGFIVPSVPMSLADACLVRMAEMSSAYSVLTLDSDFAIYRKNRDRLIPTITPTNSWTAKELCRMKVHKVETVLSLDWSHSVSVGETAMKGLRESTSQAEAEKAEDQPELNLYPLRGTVLFYEDPFEPAVHVEVWQAL